MPATRGTTHCMVYCAQASVRWDMTHYKFMLIPPVSLPAYLAEQPTGAQVEQLVQLGFWQYCCSCLDFWIMQLEVCQLRASSATP